MWKFIAYSLSTLSKLETKLSEYEEAGLRADRVVFKYFFRFSANEEEKAKGYFVNYDSSYGRKHSFSEKIHEWIRGTGCAFSKQRYASPLDIGMYDVYRFTDPFDQMDSLGKARDTHLINEYLWASVGAVILCGFIPVALTMTRALWKKLTWEIYLCAGAFVIGLGLLVYYQLQIHRIKKRLNPDQKKDRR